MATTPTLYLKRGCPYCTSATNYLDQHQIAYEAVEVRGDPAQMQTLRRVSGQAKTPTLVWNGDVLADFGIDQLGLFVRAHAAARRLLDCPDEQALQF